MAYVIKSICKCYAFTYTIPFCFQGIDLFIPFRLTEHEELLGADYTEHNVHHPEVGVTRAVSVLKKYDENVDLGLVSVGQNKGHSDYLEKEFASRLEDSNKPYFRSVIVHENSE